MCNNFKLLWNFFSVYVVSGIGPASLRTARWSIYSMAGENISCVGASWQNPRCPASEHVLRRLVAGLVSFSLLLGWILQTSALSPFFALVDEEAMENAVEYPVQCGGWIQAELSEALGCWGEDEGVTRSPSTCCASAWAASHFLTLGKWKRHLSIRLCHKSMSTPYLLLMVWLLSVGQVWLPLFWAINSAIM